MALSPAVTGRFCNKNNFSNNIRNWSDCASYFMIKSEEEFLEKKYKEEYRLYCEKVPRVIKI